MEPLNPYEPPQALDVEQVASSTIKPRDSALMVIFALLMFPCACIAAAITSLLTAEVLKDRLAGLPSGTILWCSLIIGVLTMAAVFFTFVNAMRRLA
jgi:hypothetical protein